MSVATGWAMVGLILTLGGLVGFVLYEVDQLRQAKEDEDYG